MAKTQIKYCANLRVSIISKIAEKYGGKLLEEESNILQRFATFYFNKSAQAKKFGKEVVRIYKCWASYE